MRVILGGELIRTILLAGVVLFTAVSGEVRAQSPVNNATSWDGFFLGGFVGGSRNNNIITDVSGFSNNAPGTDISYDGSGWIGGVLVGYNRQFDSLVLGVEADFTFGDLDSRTRLVDNISLDESATTNYDFITTIRARVGFAFDEFHIFATGGLAIADVENRLIDTDVGVFDPADSFTRNDTKLGYAVGGGVEWMFADEWAVRAEGMFLDFGKQNNRTTGSLAPFSHSNDVALVRFVISHRF